MNDYALTITLPLGFTETVARTRDALAGQGFGVLTEIDIAATLKAKLNVDLAPHLILGTCNPQLASAALAAQPSVGVLLPCNVVIRTVDDAHTIVEAMDPAIISQLSDNPTLAGVASQARGSLTLALQALTDSAA